MAAPQSILLTGATGSLGAVVLEQLLGDGSSATAVLRSFTTSRAYFEKRYDKKVTAGQLQFVEISDMTISDAFHNAAKGKSAIIHVASPLAKDNFIEGMIKPASEIIDNILNAAASSSVKRVIVTGSIVAVFSFLDFTGIDDVARIHIMSLSPSVPGNARYIIYSHDVSTGKIAGAVRANYPALRARLLPPSDQYYLSPPTKLDKSQADIVFGPSWREWEESGYAIVDDILRSEKENEIVN